MRARLLIVFCVASCAGSNPGNSNTSGSTPPTPTSSPTSEEPKGKLANEGEACGGLENIACRTGLVCQKDETPLPPLSDADMPSESGVGGPCGGIAGFHCQEGLVCTMSADQEHVADGMGECSRKATCVKGQP